MVLCAFLALAPSDNHNITSFSCRACPWLIPVVKKVRTKTNAMTKTNATTRSNATTKTNTTMKTNAATKTNTAMMQQIALLQPWYSVLVLLM